MMIFFISSCYYDSVLTELPNSSVQGEVSFELDIIPLLNASCNTSGCHNTGGTPPDLSAGNAYNSLISGNYVNKQIPDDSELYLWMTNKRDLPMPLAGPNPSYNALVIQWIEQGALNN